MSENRVDAVERALLILDSFKEGEDSLTLAAMAERTSLYKSTILRLAGSLERFGYLVRDSGGVYHLGPSLWRLGSLYRRSFDLGGHIRPELRRIVQATSETAAFYVREGKERVCLYRVNSPRSVRHHLDEGVRLPLNRGAAGRVLLAYDGIRGEPYKGFARTVITPRWASATPRLLPWRCLYSTRRRSCAGHCHHQRHSVGLMLRRIAALSRRCAKALTGLRLLSRAIDTANLDISQCLTR